MKRLIMCEGSNELTLVNILLENNALIFTEDDLLGLSAYHARQITTNAQVRLARRVEEPLARLHPHGTGRASFLHPALHVNVNWLSCPYRY